MTTVFLHFHCVFRHITEGNERLYAIGRRNMITRQWILSFFYYIYRNVSVFIEEKEINLWTGRSWSYKDKKEKKEEKKMKSTQTTTHNTHSHQEKKWELVDKNRKIYQEAKIVLMHAVRQASHFCRQQAYKL